MDSDSDTSDTTSSSSSSEGRSLPDEERFEPALILGNTVELPQELCENPAIFKEFFSLNTWNCLSEANKQHLRNFLPSFPENDHQEKEISLRKLFAKETFKFTSPLTDFQKNLHEGNYRPDIAKMKEILKKSRRKEQRIEERERCGQLMKEVLISRHKLLDVAYNTPPGVPLKVDRSPINPVKPAATPAALRAKKRYFQELSNIAAEVGTLGIVSDDENYPEGPPPQLSRKQKRHLNGIQGGASSPGAEGRVQSTMCHRDSTLDHLVGPGGSAPLSEERYRAMLSTHKKRRLKHDDHPELDIAEITLHDVSVRTQLASGHRRPIPSRPSSQLNQIDSKTKKTSKTIKTEPLIKVIPPPTIYKPVLEVSEPKLNHITQNKTNMSTYNDYTDSENDSIIDPVESIASIKPPPPIMKPSLKRRLSVNSHKSPKAKVVIKVAETPPISLMNVSSPIVHAKGENITISHDACPIIPQKQLVDNKINHSPVKAATLSDLEGINMMQIPIDFDDSNIDILDELNNKTPELMQETHACFLSLIRDIICSTADHRIRLEVLDKHLTAWQENPISPLNDWYSVTESWVTVLPSAINFLTGDFADQPEDFVPYLEYKPLLQMYQWIGAGRDSDNLLMPLCQYWLDRRNNMTPVQMSLLPEPDLGILERPQTPPPPRWPTLWKVRKAEPDEVAIFREQERVRYENPHKAFTYRMHGYESIVAPIKGIYNQSTGVAKARGHSMLNADRPNFVTILTLVRDATARLPNGEGTRADICELLRCSQYISSTAADNLLQSVVSGALDRMHTEYDPCVKYDPKKKIWIYLHRSRTESEFEKIHQQIQAMGKLKKNLNRKTAKPKVVKPKGTPIKSETASLQDSCADIKQEVESSVESAIVNKVSVSDKIVKPKDKPMKSSKTVMCRNSITVQPNNVKPVSIQVSNSVTSGIPYTSILANQNNRSQSPTVKKCTPTINELSNVTIQTSTNVNNAENVSVAINIAPNVTTTKPVQRQIRTNSPMGIKVPQKSIITTPALGQKPGKSIVKVTPGKSLINPNINQLVKQQNIEQIKTQTSVQSNLSPKTKIVQQGTLTATQKQLFQSLIVQQQKQQLIQTLSQQTPKVTTSVSSQHIIQPVTTITQTISPQQLLQSQQKIQLTSTVASTSSPTLTSVIPTQQVQLQQNVVQAQKTVTGTHTVGSLITPAQQQQLLQSIKQQQPQQLKQPQIQQMILKQQQQQQAAALHQLQKHLNQAGGSVTKCGTSLLGSNVQRAAVKSQTQQPLVAKVLTHASGQQVLSLESILSKQANVIPQGATAIRVGTKQSQSNQLIQLSGGSSNQVQQYAVVSQGNLISVGAPRLNVTSQVSNAASIQQVPASITRVAARPVLTGKPNQKIIQQQLTQQIVNAKLLGLQNQQGKIITTTQTNKPGLVRANLKPGTGGNTIRMVNTAGLNIAHIAGKPVILASKNNQIQGQNVIIQQSGQNDSNTNLVIGGQTLKVPQNLLTQGNVNLINTNLNQQSSSQTVMLGGQVIKVQSGQSGVSLSQPGVTGLNVNHQQTVMLGGQALKVQSSTTNNMTLNQQSVVLGQALKVQSGGQVKTQVAHQGQRVVLASQGQGGQLLTQQILLPPGFQGGAINIKTLQGLKVIPIAQQTKGTLAGRQQVFARIIPPTPPRPQPPGGE